MFEEFKCLFEHRLREKATLSRLDFRLAHLSNKNECTETFIYQTLIKKQKKKRFRLMTINKVLLEDNPIFLIFVYFNFNFFI